MKIQHTLLGISCLLFASCIKHVVVPAPEPKVVLTSTFSADTNSTNITFAKGADGYDVVNDNYREIKGSPQMSTIIYYSTLKSSSKVSQFKVAIGDAQWDAASGNFPPLATFTDFFSTSAVFVYKTGGANGVELTWKDEAGVVWTSKDTSMTANDGTFSISSATQQSDDTGDYMKVSLSFSCYLYNSSSTDSVYLQNGSFTTYFKNN